MFYDWLSPEYGNSHATANPQTVSRHPLYAFGSKPCSYDSVGDHVLALAPRPNPALPLRLMSHDPPPKLPTQEEDGPRLRILHDPVLTFVQTLRDTRPRAAIIVPG